MSGDRSEGPLWPGVYASAQPLDEPPSSGAETVHMLCTSRHQPTTAHANNDTMAR